MQTHQIIELVHSTEEPSPRIIRKLINRLACARAKEYQERQRELLREQLESAEMRGCEADFAQSLADEMLNTIDR